MTAPAPSDAEVVRRCREGDQHAWTELVDRYERYVHAVCVAYRLPRHDAEDVFQETFARIYEHLGRLRDPEALRPWIGQVTRRLCVDRLRRVRETPSDTLEPAGVDETMARLDDALAVRGALARMSANCREVLDRFFCRDQSYQEIGSALAIPSGTIASRISRCLTRLREELAGS